MNAAPIPTDPTAAIARLRACVPKIDRGLIVASLSEVYIDAPSYAACARAFAADIETLVNLTKVGDAIAFVENGHSSLDFRPTHGVADGVPQLWFPVYARVPS